MSITYYGELSIWLTYFYKINNILSITKWEIGPCLVGVTVSDIYFNPARSQIIFRKTPTPTMFAVGNIHVILSHLISEAREGGREGG